MWTVVSSLCIQCYQSFSFIFTQSNTVTQEAKCVNINSIFMYIQSNHNPINNNANTKRAVRHVMYKMSLPNHNAPYCSLPIYIAITKRCVYGITWAVESSCIVHTDSRWCWCVRGIPWCTNEMASTTKIYHTWIYQRLWRIYCVVVYVMLIIY